MTASFDYLTRQFSGLWTIHRHILDLDSEWLGRFEGQAQLTPTDEGLHYREEGMLQFGGLTAMRAERVYRWRFVGGKVEVLFADGAPFHDFDPLENYPRAEHLCKQDLYEVAYDFRNWPEWRAEWRVEGPSKDYRLVSIYRRPRKEPGAR